MRALLLLACTWAVSRASVIDLVRAADCTDRLVAVFPTVPRSGNTLFRQLFELATGTATHTVFGNTKSQRIGLSDDVFAGSSGAKTTGKLKIDKCAYVVKTHYPFFENRPLFQFGVQIRSVREPLSNYGAWIDWCYATGNNGTGFCGQTVQFGAFADRWVAHHKFWDSFDSAMTLFNFDYLLGDPIGTLRGVFGRHHALRRFLPALENSTVVDSLPVIRPSSRTQMSEDASCATRRGYFETGRHTRVAVADYVDVMRRADVAELVDRHSLEVFCDLD